VKNLFLPLIGVIILSAFGNSLLNAQSSFTNHNILGIKAGVNLGTMSYDAKEYSVYEPSYLLGPQLGLFFETNINKNISFRPEFLIIQRGVAADNYEGVDYEMSAYYFDVRLPLLYNIRGVRGFIPYFILSPNLMFPYGGEVVRNGLKEDVNADHINNFDFSLSFGAGFKVPIDVSSNFRFYLGLEAQYGFGFINTFSSTNYANNFGSRTNRGIEIAATISIPLGSSSKNNFSDDGVRSSNTSRASGSSDTIIIVRKDTIIITKQDTIILTKPPVYVTKKDCYEIREIIAYMNNDFNVKDKNICLYDINYDNNSASIDAASKKQLDEIVSLLNNISNMQMKINGHADSRGARDYNIKLANDRAKSVYDYLVSKGINSSRLKYEGYGPDKPIASNDTEQGRRQNRRVEFEITRY